MNPRICVCCGEPIHEEGNALSRNPNICASCSSLADGMEDSNLLGAGAELPDPRAVGELPAQDGLPAKSDDRELEPVVPLG